MSFPRALIDLSRIDEIAMGGRGGQEAQIASLLPGWTRVSQALYDFETTHDGGSLRLEVKRQRNLQWFDSGKYYHLGSAERDIQLLFVMHDGTCVDSLLVTRMGEFIDWLCAHRPADGWSEEVMAVAARFKDRYPTLQFKARAHVGTIFRESPGLFEILWQRRSA